MKTIDKIIDFLSNPLSYRVVIAAACTSGVLLGLNFLPLEYLKRMNLVQFFSKYGYIVLIVFLFSLFILIIQLGSITEKKRKDKKFKKHFKQQQQDLLNDELAYSYLLQLYHSHPEPVLLPLYNQKVKLLEQYELITKATTQYPIYDPRQLSNPKFPYLLQPYAEREVQKRLK